MAYEDYIAYADEAHIIEWDAGEVITYGPPSYVHQMLVSFLGELLRLFIHHFDLGTRIYAPFEVKLWSGGPSREPDIIFISKENRGTLQPQRFEGAPDLLVEVVSPSSVTEDRVRKFTQYEQAGVHEYWIIDPREHQQQCDFYRLGEDGLYHPGPVEADGTYRAAALPGFWFDTAWLWQDPLPDPQLAFAEIILSLEAVPEEVKDAYRALRDVLML
jgi:Uma2 family endonuclease